MFSCFHHPVGLLFHCFSYQRLFETCPLIFDTVFEQKWLLPKTWQTANAFHTEEWNLVQKSWKFVLNRTMISTLLYKQEDKLELSKPKCLFFPSTPAISSAMHRTTFFSRHTDNPLMGHETNLTGLFLMNESRKCQSASHKGRVRVVNFFPVIYKLIYTYTCPRSWMSNELVTLAYGQKSERSPEGRTLFRWLINRDGERIVRMQACQTVIEDKHQRQQNPHRNRTHINYFSIQRILKLSMSHDCFYSITPFSL